VYRHNLEYNSVLEFRHAFYSVHTENGWFHPLGFMIFYWKSGYFGRSNFHSDVFMFWCSLRDEFIITLANLVWCGWFV